MGFGTWPFHRVLLYRSGWSWLAAAPFFVSGFAVYVMAKRRFTADQLLGRTELHPHRHEQRLVTGGIRQYIRHPIYLGHFLELVAWSVATGMAVLYAMTAFAVLTGLVMVRLEDRELEDRFGAEYRAYRLQVPALIPRLRHRGRESAGHS
jgi:protein-S-isoprenylcysteine O-methyltransferase Ste14